MCREEPAVWLPLQQTSLSYDLRSLPDEYGMQNSITQELYEVKQTSMYSKEASTNERRMEEMAGG